MTEDEIVSVTDLINSQVSQIVKGQILLSDLKQALNDRDFFPFEESQIYQDHYGTKPSVPLTKTIGGVEFTTRILHRQGIRQSDIKGADLLYEIEGVKYILIQYKRASPDGQVSLDRPQLNTIIATCPVECKYHYTFNSRLLRVKSSRINGWCGSWYCVYHGSEARLVQACQAKSMFGPSGTVPFSRFKGELSKETFDELFASCKIGARTSFADIAAYAIGSSNADRLLFSVVQRGTYR
jgi:hypothetical protein